MYHRTSCIFVAAFQATTSFCRLMQAVVHMIFSLYVNHIFTPSRHSELAENADDTVVKATPKHLALLAKCQEECRSTLSCQDVFRHLVHSFFSEKRISGQKKSNTCQSPWIGDLTGLVIELISPMRENLKFFYIAKSIRNFAQILYSKIPDVEDLLVRKLCLYIF